MSKTTYSELLKHPNWQKKRLEILARDNFTCRRCHPSLVDKDATLNVHHCYYEYGKKPWEYPDSSLLTLCEVCHADESTTLNETKKEVLKSLSIHGLNSNDFTDLASYFSRHADVIFKIIKEERMGWNG